MSLSKLEEIRCPCGEIFEAELWNAINIEENPDLKDSILAGEVNVVCCPACNQIFYAEHFILYHDPENELLAFVYPASFADKFSYWQENMDRDFQRAMEEFLPEERLIYKPILLFGLDELVEIIRSEDEELDERSILEYIAKEVGFSLINLHPYEARKRKLPRILPKLPVKNGTIRDEVLAGLRLLLQYNFNLTKYKQALDIIENDINWTIENTNLQKSAKR